MCLETGLIRLKTTAWLRSFKFWFRILFNPTGLMYHLCSDSVLPLVIVDLLTKIKKIGLDAAELGMSERDAAYRIAKQRILDIEQQELFCAARTTCSPLYFHITTSFGKPAFFLFHLLCPQARRAVTLARCNSLPSALLLGRFNNIPYAERKCKCGSDSVETIIHMVFHCPLHMDLREKYLGFLLARMKGWEESVMLRLLLSTHEAETLENMASFLSGVVARKGCETLGNM